MKNKLIFFVLFFIFFDFSMETEIEQIKTIQGFIINCEYQINILIKDLKRRKRTLSKNKVDFFELQIKNFINETSEIKVHYDAMLTDSKAYSEEACKIKTFIEEIEKKYRRICRQMPSSTCIIS